VLAGKGESQKIMQIGLSEAAVLTRKISSLGDPRLYALQEVASRLSNSQQPLVPERLFVSNGQNGDAGTSNSSLMGSLLQLLVAEKSGFQTSNAEPFPTDELDETVQRMTKQALANWKESVETSQMQ
jgi:hypothetical protein